MFVGTLRCSVHHNCVSLWDDKYVYTYPGRPHDKNSATLGRVGRGRELKTVPASLFSFLVNYPPEDEYTFTTDDLAPVYARIIAGDV